MVEHSRNHIIICTSKLYSLVTPYLIDIFRQTVNLVGARHREVFSQDHKRFFPSNVYPRKMGERVNTRVRSNKRRGNAPARVKRYSAPETPLQLNTPSLSTADSPLLPSLTPRQLSFFRSLTCALEAFRNKVRNTMKQQKGHFNV